MIVLQPRNIDQYVGGPASLFVEAYGSDPLSYQWFKDGTAVPGATNYDLSFSAGGLADNGSYTVTAINSYGSVTSIAVAVLFSSPWITAQPQNQAAPIGGSATFTIETIGSAVTYQWSFNGEPIAGATKSSYTVQVTSASQGGTYTVAATDASGTVMSKGATLTVDSAHTVAYLVSVSGPTTVAAGSTVTFSANAGGTPPISYYWLGTSPTSTTVVSGANSVTLTNVSVLNELSYEVQVVNAYGSNTQYVAQPLTLTYTPQVSTSTVSSGQSATLSVPEGRNGVSYQWYQGSSGDQSHPIAGAIQSTFNTPWLTATTSYWVLVSGGGHTAQSSTATITMAAGSSASVFTSQPTSQAVSAGSAVTFSSAVVNERGATFQWYFNGQSLPGATSSSFTVISAQATNSGAYYVVATTAGGSQASGAAALTISGAYSPWVDSQPMSQTVGSGDTAVFRVDSPPVLTEVLVGNIGSGINLFNPPVTILDPLYQWYVNGNPIAGATASTLVVTASASTAGSYACLVSNSIGSVFSAGASLALATTPINPGRLVNLSVLTLDGQGSQLLTVGFTSGGATSGSEPVLIRGVGPGLKALGVIGALPDPTLAVSDQNGNSVAFNGGWTTPASNQAAVAAADAAFTGLPLAAGSTDSALVTTVGPGGYSVKVSSASGSQGIALGEIYDATPSYSPATTPRLINLSCLQKIPVGGYLSAGFTIGGTTSKTVLLRVTGPALAQPPFRLTGTLADPTLTLYGGQAVLANNGSWNGDAAVAAAAAAVGAFALNDPASHDCALLITLPPGEYSMDAQSATSASGVALVEVYEVP